MIRIYYKTKCNSSSKAINWFQNKGISFERCKMNQISKEDIMTMVISSSFGFGDILKKPSKNNFNDQRKIRIIENMKFNDSLKFIKVNYELIKSPIIIDQDKVMIGYNSEEIRKFLPREYRRASLDGKF